MAFWELDEIEVGIRNHDEFRLTADPAAHIDVAVSSARPSRIYGETDPRLAFAAIATAAAGDVERHGADVTDIQKLNVTTLLDNLAGDFMTQHQTGRRRSASADHVLIRSANVRRNDLQDYGVI
jgi:hypothetical protein